MTGFKQKEPNKKNLIIIASLKYLHISPSRLSCSEGGVQPWMVTAGGTIETDSFLAPVTSPGPGEAGVLGPVSVSVNLEGMQPRVTLFLNGFLPFFNLLFCSILSFSGLAATTPQFSRMDFCFNSGGGPL